MKNMFDYVEKYGDISFDEKPLTEVDILIFSQLSYVDFTSISNELNSDSISLQNAYEKVKSSLIKGLGIAQDNGINLISIMSKKNRYKDILLSNYEYSLGKDWQFGALTITDNNNFTVISFEGTDDTIAGWKEDFIFTYKYPTYSQVLASSYINRVVKLTSKNVIICGHSKGGNLALVGSMNAGILKKSKIKKIYSFDGPGLKKKEFYTNKYKRISTKLVNIIPNMSIVGVLLEQENVRVIKSTGNGIFQHDAATWVIEDDHLIDTVEDNLSIRLDKAVNSWLQTYDYEEREKIIDDMFAIFDYANIKNIRDFKSNKLKSLIVIIKNSFNLSKETKNMFLAIVKILITEISFDKIDTSKKKINSLLSKTRINKH